MPPKKTLTRQKLLIVESSSKCSIIEKYLGEGYKCISCNGHLRIIDGLKSIDVKNNFQVEYSIDPDKKAHLSKMKEIISTFPPSHIILATDHDREGEAIAWHLCDIFGFPVETTPRILFHEITRPALQAAVANPGLIDMNMVRAQQARQILDVLVGFKISPLLWRRVSDNSLSAGRCQTPALRLVYDNEIEAKTKTSAVKHKVSALFFPQNLKFDLNMDFDDEAAALAFLKASPKHNHELTVGAQKVSTRSPPKPFNTSALLQAASNLLHIGAKETMACAQILYQLGHITYMRTENRRYSPVFTEVAAKYIGEKWSPAHVNARLTEDITNNDTNNPHEAIRVTNIQMHDLVLISDTNPHVERVYKIIWTNTIQSCMAEATFNTLPLEVSAPQNAKYKHTVEIPKFAGFLALDKSTSSKKSTEDPSQISGLILRFQMLKDKVVHYNKIETTVGFTGKHSRYTEASLIDKLEEIGIGRPSTFSMLTDVIQTRGYVKRTNIEGKEVECREYVLHSHDVLTQGEKEVDLGDGVKVVENVAKRVQGAEQRKLVIDPVGIIVIEFLIEAFPELFSYDYTKMMELRLDAVASGKEDLVNICRDCYDEIKRLTKALAKIEKTSYVVDENYMVVFQKTGATLKHKTQTTEEGKPVFKSIKKTLKLDLEVLEAGGYTYEDLVELDNNNIGEWNEAPVLIKSGKYGIFMEYVDEDGNTQNKSLKNIQKPIDKIIFQDILPILSGDDIKDTSNKLVLRVFTPSLSVRKGKFGPYLYYKTRTMDKPSFFNLRNFDQGFGVCSVKDMVDWVERIYKVKV